MTPHRPPPLAILSLAPLLSLLSLLAACRQESSPQGLSAGTPTRQARIFLIAIEDGGAAGSEVGCGDSAVAVEVELPTPRPALRGSLEALLSAGKRHEGAGYYNVLANSPLRIQRFERAGDTARIHLTGYLEIGGACDSPRVLAQLERTATQFRDVKKAEFFLDGQPLAGLLSGKG